MSDDLLLKRLVNLLREHGLGQIEAERLAQAIIVFLVLANKPIHQNRQC
jgi:hypothetical protein